MRIPLDRKSETPLYAQIRDYLRENIVTGKLPANTRLPAARQLALDLGVSRVTIETAYIDLEAEGLIVRRIGSGSYVNPQAPPLAAKGKSSAKWPLWQQELVASAGDPGVGLSWGAAARDGIEDEGEVISFTGFGDPAQFRIEEFYAALRDVVRRDGVACLGIEDERGYAPLRASIAHILTSQGIEADPDDVLVTAGSQQGLAVVTQLLLKPGDTVLVEGPTYDGAIRLFRAHGLRLVDCPVDAQGMRVEALEPLLQQHHPKLIYTIPTFQNPTGACMSAARRRLLVELADRYNVPVFEDDFAGDLRYEGVAQPALKTLDPGGRVIYAGTFSKLLMPGLRLGFLVANGPVYRRLVEIKRVHDLATGSLIQRALEVYVTVGRYQAHLRRLCQIYRRRRDRMLQAIKESFPPGWEVAVPSGGLFIWLRLPEGVSTAKLAPLARARRVEYAPGTRFFITPAGGESFIRLNFASVSLEAIDEGIRRLGRAVREAMR